VSLESETVKCSHESHGTHPRMTALARPNRIVNDRPVFSSEGIYIKTMTTNNHSKKKITGRESQGACREDELIGGKPPVIK
jgi:hypothetical protein